jgi:hypothetical protein
MSKETTNLKLFQYDKETDNFDITTFNIKQCLNDNWDKLDTAISLKMDKAIKDDTLNKKYQIGINNGLLYYKEVL